MSNERIVCASCSSNNFATQAACWKCGKPLATVAPAASNAMPAVDSVPLGSSPAASHYAAVSYNLPIESPAAFWSAVAMGIVFPMIAIPVGLVFLMLDNKRKSQIGWWNILFGLIGTLLNGIVIAVSLTPLLLNASRMLPSLTGGRMGQAQTQDMNAEAPPLDLPGQRPFASPPR
jgi:ABC-type Fe3+ transport system permease subunit